MSAVDRVLDGVKAVLLLGDKVERLTAQVKALTTEVRDLDRRLICVETALELASRGAFEAKPAPPAIRDEREP